MKRTLKKTVTIIKCFDKKENKVDERIITTHQTNERKNAKEIDKIATDNNLVVIDIISQDIIKETYEMSNETFFKYATLVK